MDWLTQNWVWLALGVGAVWMFSRGRQGGAMGCCGGHDHEKAHEGTAGEGKAQRTDASRLPASNEPGAARTAEQTTSSHRHGHGGCH